MTKNFMATVTAVELVDLACLVQKHMVGRQNEY